MRLFTTKFAITGALLLIVAAGCATTGGGNALSDEEQVANVMKQYEEGLMTQDVDKIMILVSENFASAAKEDVRDFWEGFKAAGVLADVELNTDDAETEIEGEMAYVGPLFLTSAAGQLTQDFTLTKEDDGVWRVTDVAQY